MRLSTSIRFECWEKFKGCIRIALYPANEATDVAVH